MVPAAHCFWGLGCSVPKITGPLVHMAFPVRGKEAQWGVPKKQGCPFRSPSDKNVFLWHVVFWGRVRPRSYSAGCIASGFNYGSSRRV